MNIQTEESTTVTRIVFPFVSFTNTKGKSFTIPRENIVHCETYCYEDENGNEVLDPNRTFVNFTSPNHRSKGTLHAIVDQPLEMFRDHVIRPAYEGQTDTVS